MISMISDRTYCKNPIQSFRFLKEHTELNIVNVLFFLLIFKYAHVSTDQDC